MLGPPEIKKWATAARGSSVLQRWVGAGQEGNLSDPRVEKNYDAKDELKRLYLDRHRKMSVRKRMT